MKKIIFNLAVILPLMASCQEPIKEVGVTLVEADTTSTGTITFSSTTRISSGGSFTAIHLPERTGCDQSNMIEKVGQIWVVRGMSGNQYELITEIKDCEVMSKVIRFDGNEARLDEFGIMGRPVGNMAKYYSMLSIEMSDAIKIKLNQSNQDL